MWEVKLIVDDVRKYEPNGDSEIFAEACAELGTTMEEIQRLPKEYKPVVESTTTTTTIITRTEVKQPTTTTVKKSATTTKKAPTVIKTPSSVNNLDKNGNGIEDSLEATEVPGGGTTTDTGRGSGGLTAN